MRHFLVGPLFFLLSLFVAIYGRVHPILQNPSVRWSFFGILLGWSLFHVLQGIKDMREKKSARNSERLDHSQSKQKD